jgi:anti-sigma regulatory factor (Ser/Thr protein kinase)
LRIEVPPIPAPNIGARNRSQHNGEVSSASDAHAHRHTGSTRAHDAPPMVPGLRIEAAAPQNTVERYVLRGNEYTRVDEDAVDAIRDTVARLVGHRFPEDDDIPFWLHYCVHELAINAIEHGNLGVTSDEKKAQGDNYLACLERRRSEPARAGKKVFIELGIDEDGVTIQIQDQGAGFDISKKEACTDDQALLDASGRGIDIAIAKLGGRLVYTEGGTRVTLTKPFPHS